MKILIIVLVAVIVMQFITGKKKPSNSSEDIEAESKSLEKPPIAGAYQRKWLFSYNEKDAYKVLRPICDRYNLYLSSKVRLLDLVEPVKGNSKYKTYFWKVQAKHVDFVICDEKLVAKCIFELDDSSHNKTDRKERDSCIFRLHPATCTEKSCHSAGKNLPRYRISLPVITNIGKM